MNVPKLRFPEFHDDYEIKELSEITNGISSGGLSKPLENGKYKVYGSVGIIGSSKYYDYDGEKILVARVGANAGIVNKINEKCCISDNTLVLEPKNILNNYLYYSLIYFNPRKLIFGSGQPLVTGSQLKKVKIGIPHYTEQQKVADFFSLLDKKIEFQAQKIEALKLFKIGISQVMFKTANINKNLEEIALVQKGEQISSNNILSKGKYAVINGGIKPSGFLNKYNTEGNTITISEGGNSCGYVNFITQNFWCSGHCYSIKPKNKINNIYLYQLLKLHEKKLMVLRVGSGLPNIQKKDLEEYNLQIHDIGSQTVIAIILTKIDNYIILNENKSLKLQKLKKGLMQNMFI